MLVAAVRGIQFLLHTAAPRGARGITLQAFRARVAPLPSGGSQQLIRRAQSVLQHTIPRLTRFLGPLHPPANGLRHAHHRAGESVHQQLSLSSRMALSRPLRAVGMPRGPTLARPMHEVGLGTARKFSTHTTFRHVVENTSIAARAFWEVDWDVKAANERQQVVLQRKLRKDSKRSRKGLHARDLKSSMTSASANDQISTYFAEPTPAITTFLQIALAPTPTSTMPLDAISPQTMYLLPLRSIMERHGQFQAHAHDVSRIFSRLDEVNVWLQGVTVDTWGDDTGVCVELRVKFPGQSADDVKRILGDLVELPGCALQEQHQFNDNASVDSMLPSAFADAQLEFIMPSVEVIPHEPQPSFTAPSFSRSPSISDFSVLAHEEYMSDGASSYGYASVHGGSDDDVSHWSTDFGVERDWIPFSSTFLSRIQDLNDFHTDM